MEDGGLLWDWHLHCPVSVSNFVFRTLLLDDHIAITDTAKIKEIKAKYNYANHEPDVTGGIVQGVQVPTALQVKTQTNTEDTDIEVYLVNQTCKIHSDPERKTSQNQALESEQGENKKPRVGQPTLAIIKDKGGGLLNLQLRGAEVLVSQNLTSNGIEDKVYLSPKPFTRGVPNFKTGHIQPLPTIDQQDVQHYNTKVDLWSHSYAFNCPEWPEVAMEWFTRARKHDWPSTDIKEKVKSEGCYVVPTSEASWTYSFAVAERRLMSSLSPIQKYVFTLLKILWFQKLSCPRVLQMQHLRANFLRMCEEVQPGSWRPDQTTALLMYGLDSLLHQIISGEFPDYFIPSRNLLSGISEDFLDATQVALAEARSDALTIFIDFNLSFQFDSNLGLEREVFEPILDVTESRMHPQNEAHSFMYVLVPFLLRLMINKAGTKDTELTKNVAFEKITLFHRQVENLVKEKGMELKDGVWDFVVSRLHENIYWSCFLYEYIIEKVDLPAKHTYMGNLGCNYHSMYVAGEETYKSKAKDMFEAAMAESGVTASTKADYVVFLRYTQDWQRAKDLITDIVNSDELTAANSYDSSEIVSLHPDMRAMAEALGGQLETVPALAHMFFLSLVEDQIVTEGVKRENAIKDFKDFCDKTKNISETFSPTSYALLGLAMAKIEKREEAVEAFQMALDVGPDEEWEKWLAEKLISYGQEPKMKSKETTEKSKDRKVAEELKKEAVANEDELLLMGSGDEENEDDAENEKDDEEGEGAAYDEEEAIKKAIMLSLMEQKNVKQEAPISQDEDSAEEEDDEEMLQKAIELSMQITY